VTGIVCTFLTHQNGRPLTSGVVADLRTVGGTESNDASARELVVFANRHPGACAYGKVVLLRQEGIFTYQATASGDAVPVFCGNSTAAALSFLGIASAVETRIHGRATIPYQISARAVGDKVTQRWIVPSVASEARNWRGMRVLLLPTLNDYAIVLGRLPLDVSAQMARDELLGSAEAGKLAVVCETPSGPVVEFYNGNGRHGAVPQTGAATISLAIRSNPCLGHYFPNGRLTYLTKKGRRKAQLPAVSDTKCGRLAVEMPPISVRLDPVEVELVA